MNGKTSQLKVTSYVLLILLGAILVLDLGVFETILLRSYEQAESLLGASERFDWISSHQRDVLYSIKKLIFGLSENLLGERSSPGFERIDQILETYVRERSYAVTFFLGFIYHRALLMLLLTMPAFLLLLPMLSEVLTRRRLRKLMLDSNHPQRYRFSLKFFGLGTALLILNFSVFSLFYSNEMLYQAIFALWVLSLSSTLIYYHK